MGLFNDRCTNCSRKISKLAEFCRFCGSPRAAAWRSCAKCGSSVGADSKHCWNCSDDLDAQGNRQMFQERWRLAPGDFALRVSVKVPDDRIEDGLQVDNGLQAAILKEGKFKGSLTPGFHTFSGLFSKFFGSDKGGRIEAVLMPTVPIDVDFQFDRLRTADNIAIDAFVCATLEVESPDKVDSVLMRGRESLREDGLMQAFYPDVQTAVRQALAEMTLDQILVEVDERGVIAGKLEDEIGATLAQNGLKLNRVRLARLGGEGVEKVLERRSDFAWARREEELRREIESVEKGSRLDGLKSEFEFLELEKELREKYSMGDDERARIRRVWDLRQDSRSDQEIAEIRQKMRDGERRLESADLESKVRLRKDQLRLEEELDVLEDERSERRKRRRHRADFEEFKEEIELGDAKAEAARRRDLDNLAHENQKLETITLGGNKVDLLGAEGEEAVKRVTRITKVEDVKTEAQVAEILREQKGKEAELEVRIKRLEIETESLEDEGDIKKLRELMEIKKDKMRLEAELARMHAETEVIKAKGFAEATNIAGTGTFADQQRRDNHAMNLARQGAEIEIEKARGLGQAFAGKSVEEILALVSDPARRSSIEAFSKIQADRDVARSAPWTPSAGPVPGTPADPFAAARAAQAAGGGFTTSPVEMVRPQAHPHHAPNLSQDLRRHADRAADSVALLVASAPGEQAQPVATAWAFGPRVLATNAHVALALREYEKNGWTCHAVFPNGGSPRRCQVTGSLVHKRFRQNLADSAGNAPAVPAYDVALLQIDSDAPSTLPVAAPAKLFNLRQGDQVAYLGFPMENLVGRANVERPASIYKSGNISAVTDWWQGSSVEPAERRLVIIDIAVAGGSSGSPLFDSSGEVIGIVSSGNMEIGIDPESGRHTRNPNAADVNFAMRIDIIGDLLAGDGEL